MKNEKNTKTEKKEREFYYIIYQYNNSLNDIEYITSKQSLIDSINAVNGMLLSNGDNINIIKDIERIVKNRNISKYITLDINNLKVINKYIIFKQYKDDIHAGKYILNSLEKNALNNNDIIINKMYKKELIDYKYNTKKRILKAKKWNDKNFKLDKIDAFKKYMEIKKKIENNFNRLHENKNIVIGGGVYE